MEKTLEAFKAQQLRNINILDELTAFLEQGEKVGVPVDVQLIHKIEAAKENAANGKLKIALIGGFSEGKTSIAAAWMGRLDKASMNISHQESSNEVKVYDVGSDFVLIDTPGLFGFKEQFNEDTRAVEKYKDMTKKYISEAHLILYVMNSTNPIKESHKADLEWLFRTLNLLDRTVFVLSRFDEVADVEDEEDYTSNMLVKRQNVSSRLSDLIALTQQERDALSIVAVAANPFDMGTEYWLENPDKFQALSHIVELQDATSYKIERSGGALALSEETKKSVIKDILFRKLPEAIANDDRIKKEVEGLSSMHTRLSKELLMMQRDITDARISLKTFVTDYFKDLILRAKGLSLETYVEFFENEIGEKGIVINTRLENEFDRRVQSVNNAIRKMHLGYSAEINHYNGNIAAMGKQGLNYIVKSNFINSTTVIAARDGVVTVGKMAGLELGKFLKFKPWGAIKFAKGMNGALVFVGVALELWDTYNQAKREEEFKKMIESMVGNFNQQREGLINTLEESDFDRKHFTGFAEMQDEMTNLETTMQAIREQQSLFSRWRADAEAIDAEYTRAND
ncbi:LeoA/HP0731 family dynamin-like GTPase [Citrobacter sp. HN-141]|uniref:LeoA/HP0731 family dynamin-like GTPase n=1 Tax=unclassified Citrobacter TaxID=2644389 RepID=UPI0029656435|nr:MULTISPECIES: LeoA/HP0731 family dynamin-like GTPase [unclassified Citrobacter]MDW2643666.1 LeoA/HP0731 family dynamin-like GTPase [Citrobacter sp. HN-141]MDW2653013.1 LeoA/HP0731 family dynamin-like GTPase [Citrobacter sp. HN-120]MDW2696038.1 LeoA/HP0731 family dynamin-like GTPase [Citrobacter sp. HN-144]